MAMLTQGPAKHLAGLQRLMTWAQKQDRCPLCGIAECYCWEALAYAIDQEGHRLVSERNEPLSDAVLAAAHGRRFQNTLADLRDCYNKMPDQDLSPEEEAARKALVRLCQRIVREYSEMAQG